VIDAVDAQRALDLGADVVAVGRAAIGNARIPERFLLSEPLTPTPFVRDRLAKMAVSKQLIDSIGNSPSAGLGIIEAAL
jgi:2,4-dienoyl-CoA reductase-like NADH-dependent reductase (Old Yellow Enzyme family)